MTNQQIADILQQKYPGAHWVLSGDSYAGLTWLDDPSTKPTATELGL